MADETGTKGTGLTKWLKGLLAGMGGVILLAALLFGGLVWLLRSSLSRGDAGLAPKGTDVSAAAYVDAAGARHTLAEQKGKVVILDLWATWCPPCQKSMPNLAKLAAASGGDYVVLPVSVEDAGVQAVVSYFQRRPDLAGLPALATASHGEAPLGSVPAIPTTFLIGRDGRVLDAWSGVQEERLETGLKRALGR